MRPFATLAGAALLLTTAATSLAAGPQDKKAADALFKDGRAAFDKGDLATACSKFDASYKLDAAPGTLLNLAVCEERSGRLVAARRHVAELVPKLGPKDDRLQFANELAGKLDGRIPTLTLSLAPGAPASTVVREGAEGDLGLGSPVQLDPGDHELVITASGHAEARLKITLAEGAREQRSVAPGAPVAPVATAKAPDADAEKSRKMRRTIGYVAGGVGVAGVGLAAITGVTLLSKKSELDDHCPNQKCDATGVKLLADDKSTALLPLNTVGWIVGAVGLGAGAALIVTSRAPAKAEAARLVPVASPQGGGLFVDGRF